MTTPEAAPRFDFREDVLGEQAEVAGLMIIMRESMLDATEVYPAGLASFDERIDGHLDGLRAAGHRGFGVASDAVRDGRDGSLFVATVLAVEQRRDEDAARLVAHAATTEGGRRQLEAALAWVPRRSIEPWAAAFITRGEAESAAALIALHAHRLRPPFDVARRMAGDECPWRRALAYRAIADADGDTDDTILEPGRRDPCPDVRLAALWASARKSSSSPRPDEFVAVAAERTELAERAFDLAARCGAGDARAMDELFDRLPPGNPGHRAGIRVVVASGLPKAISWLWPRLRDAHTAQLAGWAYATVTGADLHATGLLHPAPAPRGVGPTDDPADEATRLPPEYRAPWPDAALIEADWRRRQAECAADRILFGRAMTPDALRSVLAGGAQATRAHAALELSLRERQSALFDTRAPAFRQRASFPS